MTKEQAEAAVVKYGSLRAAARALKCDRGSLSNIIKGKAVKMAGKPAEKPTAGRNLAAFKQTYHKDTIIPAKIKAGLKSLGAAWEYEVEFVRRCGVSQSDMATYRDGFSDNWLQLRDGKKVWSSVAMVKQMKGML
jgi:hypothetical protein